MDYDVDQELCEALSVQIRLVWYDLVEEQVEVEPGTVGRFTQLVDDFPELENPQDGSKCSSVTDSACQVEKVICGIVHESQVKHVISALFQIAEAKLLSHVRDVIQPGKVPGVQLLGSILGELLRTTPEKALRVGDRDGYLAVDVEQESEYPVCSRMSRPEVDGRERHDDRGEERWQKETEMHDLEALLRLKDDDGRVMATMRKSDLQVHDGMGRSRVGQQGLNASWWR